MANYQTFPPTSSRLSSSNDHFDTPSPTVPPQDKSSGPPRISLDFDRLDFDGSLGALELDKSSIPSPEHSYDMVSSGSSSDVRVARGGGSYKPMGSTSNSNVDLQPRYIGKRQSAVQSTLLQLDGVSDELQPHDDSRFSESPASSPKRTSAVAPTTSATRNRVDTPTTERESPASSYNEPKQLSRNRQNEQFQYIAYNPNSSQPPPFPPSTEDSDERSLPSDSRLFDDFDGVHCEVDLHLDLPSEQQRSPLHKPSTHANRPSSYPHSSPQLRQSPKSVVFYPAPVPATLNLPPPLAKPRNNRASQVIPNRKSIAGFTALGPASPTTSETPSDDRKKLIHRSMANLPPQLRASLHFEQIPQPVELELKDESAVATFDSLLDAAAKAPPVAFTEHPIAAGPAFQRPMHVRSRSSVMLNSNNNRISMASLGGQLNNRHSVANLAGNNRSSITMVHDELPPQSQRLSIFPDKNGSRETVNERGTEQLSENDHRRPDSQVFGQHLPQREPSPLLSSDPNALPTTLLAELEARKAQLRSRNRTAASAFPTGMRSTLLELDAVAQVQKKARAQKRTNLAWENPENMETEEADEDVPLGLLYAGANHGGSATRKHDYGVPHNICDEDTPLGLIVKREIEDNEPLSKRKERLKVQSTPDASATEAKRTTMFLDVPGINVLQPQDSEVEDEPLALRMKRIKEQKQNGFGSGSLGLTLDGEDGSKGQIKPVAPTPLREREETLGQRRRRLQAEKEQREKLKRESTYFQPDVRQMNMISIIQHHQNMPVQVKNQNALAGVLNPGVGTYSGANGFIGAMPGVNAPLAGVGMLGMGGGSQGGRMSTLNPTMVPMMVPTMVERPQSTIIMGTSATAGLQMQAPVQVQNTKQMEMVERWRSSVTG